MADRYRELLELAAKAAGYVLKWGDVYIVGEDEIDCTDMPYVVSGQPDEADWHWDPLTDDGDALRLAVKLNLSADFFDDFITVGYTVNDDECKHVDEPSTGDPYAATRRAIVRAAAAIGGGK